MLDAIREGLQGSIGWMQIGLICASSLVMTLLTFVGLMWWDKQGNE